MEEDELIEHIQAGELQFMNPLIERHYESICKYCYWKIRNTEAAQDITQETFYKFFRSFENYIHHGKCRAYLYTIARNLCNNYLTEQQAISLEDIDEIEKCENVSLEETVENEQLVYQLIADLPPEQKEVVVLRFCYDLKFKEISIITGTNICTVQYRLKRGLASLTKKLEEGNYEKAKQRPYCKTIEDISDAKL